MARKTPRERYLIQFGLDLSLYGTGDGWGYEWRDPSTGQRVAGGWSRGTKREGKQEAVRDIKERGVWKMISKARIVGETTSLPKAKQAGQRPGLARLGRARRGKAWSFSLKPRAGHTSVRRGKKVFVVLTNGDKFVDRFSEKRSTSVVFEDRGAVSKRLLKSMTIYRAKTGGLK